ncbi:Rrf2 family transcriptional regulator [Klebsiella michiganensis]|nr:Rrf2 family transcriptional regulator [Klebsiella michiganensis]MDD9628947.1 Rrf2 family transcriptional regulator [Klebsiella michiganensis]MDD9636334.1 Rrf2 family transcriptional regulator [Klebsiella michiganensis]MDD9645388.1 Rrf2 family transcriptional regulator [Klebsiella michiganensis]MDD9658134.1 Rrf2 family transcriptional regulator [Klebsiella michiganensis]MDM6775991.1 Rrf2 family transcriptional regulator [Klebsiella michiganensis]
MGKIMKVAIEVNGEVIWYRDSETLEGMASLGYLKDGTQQKIIAALEDALNQAKGEHLCWNDGN